MTPVVRRVPAGHAPRGTTSSGVLPPGGTLTQGPRRRRW